MNLHMILTYKTEMAEGVIVVVVVVYVNSSSCSSSLYPIYKYTTIKQQQQTAIREISLT